MYPLGDNEGFFIGRERIMKTKYITRWITIGIFIVIFLGIAGFFFRNLFRVPSVSRQPTKTQTVEKPLISLTLDKNGDIATFSAISAKTPYEALVVVSQKERIPLVSKQYDFGVFVQKIGDLESGPDMAWIVSVNGNSLTVAADKEDVKTGDMVEWSYKKAIY